jgi:hypothetical protein
VRASSEGYSSVRAGDVGTYAWRVGPLGGTQYGIYATNWTYGIRMPVQNIRTWPRRDISDLGLTDGDINLQRGLDCDILAQGFNRIDRILIPPKYTFFSGSPTAKNFGIKHF